MDHGPWAKSKGKPNVVDGCRGNGRLWDPSGVLYEREVEELTTREAFALVRDSDIQAAVSHASRPLRWLAPHQRQTVLLEELAPNSHDEPNWKPPKGAPGQLPFHAELWRSGARRVVLVTDRD